MRKIIAILLAVMLMSSAVGTMYHCGLYSRALTFAQIISKMNGYI